MKHDVRYLCVFACMIVLLPGSVAVAEDRCGELYPGFITTPRRWAYLDTVDASKTHSLHLKLSGATDFDSLDGATCKEGSTKSPNMVEPQATLWSAETGTLCPAYGPSTDWTPTQKGEGFRVQARVEDAPSQYHDDKDAYTSVEVSAFEVYVVQNLTNSGGNPPAVTNPDITHRASQTGLSWSGFDDFGSGLARSAVFAPEGGSEDLSTGTATSSWAFCVDPPDIYQGGGVIKAAQMIVTGASQEIGVDDADMGREARPRLSFGVSRRHDPSSFSVSLSPEFSGNCDEGMGLTSWGYTLKGAGGLGIQQTPYQNTFRKASSELDDPLLGSYFGWELRRLDPIAYFQPTRFSKDFDFSTGVNDNHFMPNQTMQAHLATYAYASSHKEQAYGNGYADARVHDWSMFVFVKDVEFIEP